MKRAKKFVAIVAIAAITFGSAISVFAEDSATTATAAAYENLAYTQKNWYYEDKDCGVYPAITGMDSLNSHIEDYIWKASLRSDIDFKFKVSYDIEDVDRYATILLKFDYDYATMFKGSDGEAFWFFVDKETMKEISQEDYDKLIAEAAATATEEPVAPIASEEKAEASDETAAAEEDSDEIAMVGVREYAEALGFTVEWNDTLKAVTLVFEEDIYASFKVDVNTYTFGDETVELETAPVNQDGTVFVPVTFFECLGAEVSYAKDGSVSAIAFPDEEA